MNHNLVSKIKEVVWHRLSNVPDEIRGEGFKYVVLNVLDQRWKEHLRNIDMMQEGIGLRGYAQKNPIVEYKLEAYELFNSLKSSFMKEALSLLSRLEIQSSAAADLQYESTPTKVQTLHSEYGQFGSMGGSGNAKESKLPGKSQPMKRTEKIGRNDPCWCGSGKKYKNCHMEEDQKKVRSVMASSMPIEKP